MPSPGEDVQSWSVTAANNGTADTLINWQEGQTRASVNNSSRSELAAHAKNRNLNNGSIVTTGSANAQAFISGVNYGSVGGPIPTGLRCTLKVGAGLTNTSSTTLNMDGLGDVLIKTADGNNLLGGEFIANGYVDLVYNGTNWIFLYGREFFFNLATAAGGIIIGKQVFDVAGTFTYTPSVGMECCIIEAVGAGGGGGCASAAVGFVIGGGGGGSGGYSRKIATAIDIGTSQTVTVGAAGTAAATPSTGGVGGDTSVGTLCIAKGGQGGGGSLAGASLSPGGAGGVSGTGDLAGAGTPGEPGAYEASSSTVTPVGGAGGSSAFGGGAVGNVVVYGSTIAGANAGKYGAGGAGSGSAGGSSFSSAGAGSAGLVIITEFAGRGAPGRDGATGPIGPVGPSGPGTGDVLRSGTPTAGQIASWTDASHIQGVAASSIVAGVAVGTIAMQTFTANGTYTPTAGMKFCIIEAVGGGGGGGGVSGDPSYVLGAGGGGAGGYSRKRATAAEIGASKAVTIGAGGAGGAFGTGISGGATSVGTLCVANGGNGGSGASTSIAGSGGIGATAGTGDVAATGANGSSGIYWASAPTGFGPPAGMGGNSYYGGGGAPGLASSTGPAIAGGAARAYGGGGGGASANSSVGTTTAAGGVGTPGIVVITEFI